MRRGRLFTGALAVMLAALFWAPSGPAKGGGATPQDIARDLSDGVLNGQYTKAELERFVKDATLQQYGTTTSTTGSSTTSSSTQSTSVASTTSGTQGVAGTSTGTGGQGPLAVSPKSKPLAATKARGGLPFTGAQLGLFAIVGLALLAMGLLLRSTGRRRPTTTETTS